MDNRALPYLYALVFALGLVLTVGGISSGKAGATVISLIVAAVSLQRWMRWNRDRHGAPRP